jgi:hypothetical protein
MMDYVRGQGFRRPSRSVALATVAVSGLLAVAGLLVGKPSDNGAPPASVPFTSAEQPSSGNPIIVPSTVEFPRR